MDCPECARLLAEYERHKNDNAVAMQQLHIGAVRRLQFDEFRKLLATVNEAWIDADRSRLELEEHRRTHENSGSSILGN
jgi:hypothetical protein